MTCDNTLGTGYKGEEFACRYLIEHGYRIIDRNWRSAGRSRYEIDIVAEDNETIVFCEVKTAKTTRFGSPVSWVTEKKARRIAQAALEYITTNMISRKPLRFDVIGLEIIDENWSVIHIPNAFPVPEDT